jgi:hypothetical protein
MAENPTRPVKKRRSKRPQLGRMFALRKPFKCYEIIPPQIDGLEINFPKKTWKSSPNVSRGAWDGSLVATSKLSGFMEFLADTSAAKPQTCSVHPADVPVSQTHVPHPGSTPRRQSGLPL